MTRSESSVLGGPPAGRRAGTNHTWMAFPMSDMPELTESHFAKAIPASLRRRLIGGQFESGADVVALRRFVGLPQRQFAIALGVTVHTLCAWEQSREVPEGPALALLGIAATTSAHHQREHRVGRVAWYVAARGHPRVFSRPWDGFSSRSAPVRLCRLIAPQNELGASMRPSDMTDGITHKARWEILSMQRPDHMPQIVMVGAPSVRSSRRNTRSSQRFPSVRSKTTRWPACAAQRSM